MIASPRGQQLKAAKALTKIDEFYLNSNGEKRSVPLLNQVQSRSGVSKRSAIQSSARISRGNQQPAPISPRPPRRSSQITRPATHPRPASYHPQSTVVPHRRPDPAARPQIPIIPRIPPNPRSDNIAVAHPQISVQISAFDNPPFFPIILTLTAQTVGRSPQTLLAPFHESRLRALCPSKLCTPTDQ